MNQNKLIFLIIFLIIAVSCFFIIGFIANVENKQSLTTTTTNNVLNYNTVTPGNLIHIVTNNKNYRTTEEILLPTQKQNKPSTPMPVTVNEQTTETSVETTTYKNEVTVKKCTDIKLTGSSRFYTGSVKLKERERIVFLGQVSPNFTRFNIDFITNSAAQDRNLKIALHLANYGTGQLILNSRASPVWQMCTQEIGYHPFRAGKPFNIEVGIANFTQLNAFQLFVNNSLLYVYTEKRNLETHKVNHFLVRGDVSIFSVKSCEV